MNISTETQPVWYNRIPEERRALWTQEDGDRELTRRTLAGYPVRVVLKDGTILDGTKGEERHRFDNRHDIAIHMQGRKTQKWVPEDEIAVLWADAGPDLSDIVAALAVRLKDAYVAP